MTRVRGSLPIGHSAGARSFRVSSFSGGHLCLVTERRLCCVQSVDKGTAESGSLQVAAQFQQINAEKLSLELGKEFGDKHLQISQHPFQLWNFTKQRSDKRQSDCIAT